jgi:ATPase subunit of ABC transporter with duplicated ATPase domains
MIALEVRDLIVEVGGKIVVASLSFDLRPGDKVGVVGRNGAGKTSTMKVLTGEAEPAGGSVLRRGSVGYLRQDPRQHRAEDDDLALEHVLAARGLVELSTASRRRALSNPRERSITPVLTSGGGVRCSAAIGPNPGQDDRGRLGLPQGRLELPVKHLSGGEASSQLANPVRGRTCSCWMSRPPGRRRGRG